MKENNNLIKKSKLMIGLFSFLGIMMIFAIATTNLTSKGTYSATTMTCSCKDGGTWSQSEGICKKTTSSVDTKTCSSNASGDGCATYKSNGYSCEAISSSAQGATFSCTKTIYNDASYTPPASDCKVSCDAGKYLSTDGTCKTCSAGYYCVGGESGAHLCDVGKYCPNEGMSVGLTCPANSYCGSGAKSPTSCPVGKTSPAGSKSESDCVASNSNTCTESSPCVGTASTYYYNSGGTCKSGYTRSSEDGTCFKCNTGYEQVGDTCKSTTCISKNACQSANKGYACYEDTNNKGCYIKGTAKCYACTKDSKTYYTYTNEGGCPLADNYERCAVDTKGKNRLYLMQYDRSTGSTSTINVLECNYDAVEECTVNPGGTWYHEKECIRNVGNTTNVTINGDTTWWTCVGTPSGGGSGGDNPPASGTTPSNPSSSEKKTCYVCVSGEKSQYVWASSSANAASAATTLTGITSKNCATTSESNCSGIPVTNCYECNGSKKYVMADSDADAKSKSGGSNCTVVTTDKCNTVTPPATGTVGIIVAWIIGILTIGYSLWYFKKSSSLNK